MDTADRYQHREKLINNEEFLNGFYTTENYCARMKAHISKMKSLGGDHLNDIETYIDLMKAKPCTNIPSGGSRRRANKHSKKSRKSRKSRKTKSRKTKSRRH